MSIAFVLRPNEGEGWREYVERIAGEQGLQDECLFIFDEEVGKGEEPEHAAFSALYEWDCCPVENLGGRP